MANDKTAGRGAFSPSATVRVQRMVDLIQKIYAQRVTLATLGVAMRAKPEQLGRLFRHVVGFSVHAYVTRVRLEQAAHLVRSGLKIEAVAHAVGYQSKKNFFRQFVRHYGVTPKAYRRRRGIPKPGHPSKSSPRSGNRGPAGMTTYAARFNHIACIIDVEARRNVRGRPTYFAMPFVLVNQGLQPFASTSDHIEISGATEADALERAAVFLEHRFGSRAGALKRCHHATRVRTILVPRP